MEVSLTDILWTYQGIQDEEGEFEMMEVEVFIHLMNSQSNARIVVITV